MTLRVSAIQFQHRAADKDFNLQQLSKLAEQAAAAGSQLAVFPEMCLCGYWHIVKQDEAALHAQAEPIDGPSVQRVMQLAQKQQMAIGAGLLEKDASGALFNSYVVCMPDGQRHVHRKLHAFEHPALSSGDHYTVFDTPWGIKAGILICWDNNLVENVRATALLGAELLLAPHQTGGTASRSPHGMKPIPTKLWHRRVCDPATIEAAFRGPNGREWLMRWLPARAHDNGLFLIFSNGVGQDEEEVRTGNAMILDPYGRILAETWQAADAVVTTDLDLSLLDRCTGQRWLRGRRPELYGILTEPLPHPLTPHQARFSETPTR